MLNLRKPCCQTCLNGYLKIALANRVDLSPATDFALRQNPPCVATAARERPALP
jgi:hypothetical protein